MQEKALHVAQIALCWQFSFISISLRQYDVLLYKNTLHVSTKRIGWQIDIILISSSQYEV